MPDRKRIESYLDRLFAYALSLTNDRDAAFDLVQDCAVRALSARRVPHDEPAYRAWLFRILRNAFIDGRRRRGARPPQEGGEPEFDPTELWRYEQTLTNGLAVHSALAQLRDDQRELIALIDLAGLTYAEAAALLELPVGTVMSRLSRARAALLKRLADGNVVALPIKAGKTRR